MDVEVARYGGLDLVEELAEFGGTVASIALADDTSGALALNPNDDLIVVQQGEVLTWIGEAEPGIEWIQKAMRLNPYHPERFWNYLGRAYFVARRYSEAVKAFQRINRADHSHLSFLAAC